MKKIIFLIVAIGFITYGCSDQDYEDLNRNPDIPSEASSDALFASATISLFDQMASTNVNLNVFRLFSQYWNETTYTDESNYEIVERNIPRNHWRAMYQNVLYDLKVSKDLLASEDLTAGQIQNREAMIGLLEVYAWQQMVDTYGDIPYFEALQTPDILTPVYTDAQEIYADLFTRVATARGQFVMGEPGFGVSDLVYGNDYSKWIKFANSLQLRLAMRIAEGPMSSVAQTKAEEAVSLGVFTSNADNFSLQYEGVVPNTNPLYEDLVTSGRSDFVAANTVVDYMNNLEDPRRPIYFAQNLGEGVYQGGTYGATSAYATNSHIGDLMHEPTFRGVLLDYSEVEFMLAQAAELGFSVGGTPESHYNEGILASMEDWGVDSDAAAEYLLRTDVAYSTAPGTWKEKIGKQFWLAMYNRGFEGWTVWRQFNAPTLNVAADSGSPVPLRYTYPVEEQTLNNANWAVAAEAIGGDEQQTPLFWDVN